MAVVNATIKNRITTVPDGVELICNNPTDVIEIDFDEEWSGKTGYVARFEWNGKYFDVPFEGTQVKVPEISNTGWIMFGVYADNITAAPVKIKCKKSILCYGDGVRQVPANPFYDEFVDRLEDVEEAVKNGGGGGQGAKGEPGIYFIPSIDAYGNLTYEASEPDENGIIEYIPMGNIKGRDGKDGADGVSVTHEWIGTKLKVSSASGVSVVDLKGEPGKDAEPEVTREEFKRLSEEKVDKFETFDIKVEAQEIDIIDDSFVTVSNDVSGSDSTVCTNPIPINFDSGSQVVVRCAIIGHASLVFLDAAGNVLLGINGNNASDYGITPGLNLQIVTVAVPAGSKFVRMSAYKNAISGLSIPYTQPSDIWISGMATLSVPEKITQNTLAIEKNEEYMYGADYLFGKKLACVGDSITEATNPEGGYFKNYAEIVANRHSMTVYKDGKGGSTMANTEGHNPFCVSRYLNVPSDFDILTIWFGWNDASYSTIGTIEDTEDATFYGAYKKVLEHFITTYPTKKIGLIAPYGNASVEPFRVAVRALSEMYGVPCLDLADGKQCSLLWGTANVAQEARRAALTYDSTHPNQAGHEYLSTMYEEFIKRL